MIRCCFFFPQGENKGFTYCFQAALLLLLLLTLSDDGEYVNIAWAPGSKVTPCSNSSRSMALDKWLLARSLSRFFRSVQQRETHRLKRDEWKHDDQTFTKRHEGKLWSSPPMVEIKKRTDVETPSHHKDEALSK